ncbi:hypothetical protein J2S10_002652 [Neobacillus ginsengisoli]|uniref:Secreted protein n=1 Tax=Neobacillus ginsengisoli TaxID=904295 RepID=A0ABT9XW31_9BACI|nr:hypothetical protein [Neobacillus ginsengisoli]
MYLLKKPKALVLIFLQLNLNPFQFAVVICKKKKNYYYSLNNLGRNVDKFFTVMAGKNQLFLKLLRKTLQMSTKKLKGGHWLEHGINPTTNRRRYTKILIKCI